jgi:hypothetical protein
MPSSSVQFVRTYVWHTTRVGTRVLRRHARAPPTGVGAAVAPRASDHLSVCPSTPCPSVHRRRDDRNDGFCKRCAAAAAPTASAAAAAAAAAAGCGSGCSGAALEASSAEAVLPFGRDDGGGAWCCRGRERCRQHTYTRTENDSKQQHETTAVFLPDMRCSKANYFLSTRASSHARTHATHERTHTHMCALTKRLAMLSAYLARFLGLWGVDQVLALCAGGIVLLVLGVFAVVVGAVAVVRLVLFAVGSRCYNSS